MMTEARAYPEGMEWSCSNCGKKYPEDYESDFCVCGHPLTRVILEFKL